MKKEFIKKVLGIAILCVLFGMSFSRVTHILAKKEHKNDPIYHFYQQEKDSLDVLCFGTSHAYHSFSPLELEEKYGISSYTLGTSSQSIQCSYYLMKDAVKKQHPKVIVFEIHGVKYMEDYYSLARVHVAMDGMPLNLTKLEMCKDYLSNTLNFEEQLEFIFPIIKFHTRWEELKKVDFEQENAYLRGFLKSKDVEEQRRPEKIIAAGDKEEVYENVRIYFDKIIQLCKENDVSLLIYQAPMGADDEEFLDVHKKTGYMMDYAQQQGIDVIDFEKLVDEIELDYSNDFVNSGHVNVNGAMKITDYLGDYLKTNVTCF